MYCTQDIVVNAVRNYYGHHRNHQSTMDWGINEVNENGKYVRNNIIGVIAL